MQMNLHTDEKLTQLLLCSEAEEAKTAFMQTMRYWDGLETWQLDDCPNYGIMENHYAWCDLSSGNTYCMYEQLGGFFGPEGMTLHAGGLEAEMLPCEETKEKLCIAGYKWTPEGQTYLLSNTHALEDGMNEAWADLDDWIYEPLWGWGYNPDGTEIPPGPPGHIRAYERDENGDMQMTWRPMPELDMEKTLLQAGFKRPRYETEQLERLLGDD